MWLISFQCDTVGLLTRRVVVHLSGSKCGYGFYGCPPGCGNCYSCAVLIIGKSLNGTGVESSNQSPLDFNHANIGLGKTLI